MESPKPSHQSAFAACGCEPCGNEYAVGASNGAWLPNWAQAVSIDIANSPSPRMGNIGFISGSVCCPACCRKSAAQTGQQFAQQVVQLGIIFFRESFPYVLVAIGNLRPHLLDKSFTFSG